MTWYQYYLYFVHWPEPIERFYQATGGQPSGNTLAPRAPHLSTSDIMFMTGVMSSPQRL